MGQPHFAYPGLSHTVGDPDAPFITQTIGAVLQAAAVNWPDQDALVSVRQDIRWSWRELALKADALAANLLALGLSRGDRIGIWAPNCAEWVLTQFAAARAGLVLVTINPAYRVQELEYTITAVEMRAIVIAPRFKTSDYEALLRTVAPELDLATPGKLASKTVPSLQIAVLIGETSRPGLLRFQDLCEPASAAALQLLEQAVSEHRATDPINIQFTSGTTGRPKGATLSDRNIINNGANLARALGFTPRDRLCLPMPLYHCFGMVMGVLACVTTGATIVLPAETFNAQAVLHAIETERCTALYGVPTMYITLLADPALPATNVSTLRTGVMSGALCPIDLMEGARDRLGIKDLIICYGMTETSPVNHQTSPSDPVALQVSTVGRVQPHLECKIVDPHGNTVPIGEPGEICTRGYAVMLGYWGDPEQTARAIDADGWMHSGDLATLDENGYARIVGRIKDMIIRGGENIYPAEIEAFLRSHPHVRDVHVVGIPDEKFGEAVCACIMPMPGEIVALADIVDFCRDRIAHFKVPAQVHLFDEFPMTVTGKVQKFILRDMVTGAKTA